MRKYTTRMNHKRKLLAFEVLSSRDEKVPSIFVKKPTLEGDTVTVYLKNGPSLESLDSYLRIGFNDPSEFLWELLDKAEND